MRDIVQHCSCYRYPRPALLGPQLIRLRPADHVRARLERYQLQIAHEHRSEAAIKRFTSAAEYVRKRTDGPWESNAC